MPLKIHPAVARCRKSFIRFQCLLTFLLLLLYPISRYKQVKYHRSHMIDSGCFCECKSELDLPELTEWTPFVGTRTPALPCAADNLEAQQTQFSVVSQDDQQGYRVCWQHSNTCSEPGWSSHHSLPHRGMRHVPWNSRPYENYDRSRKYPCDKTIMHFLF